jgi:molybdenum cofactor biosynthesis protein B
VTVRRLRVATVTCSDTRTARDDASGKRLGELLVGAGHELVGHRVVTDDAAQIAAVVEELCDGGSLDAVILTGGTGLARRDVTLEAIRPLLDKELDGFGEAFRRLSWEQVGARSILSRATAGSRGRTVVAALPGSIGAVELAMTDVLLPILGHAVDLLGGRTAHGGGGGC